MGKNPHFEKKVYQNFIDHPTEHTKSMCAKDVYMYIELYPEIMANQFP